MASHWVAGLQAMTDAIRTTGAAPVLDPKALHPAIVLAVDELLPDNLVLTPRTEALLGSTAICVQRFMLRGAIRDAASATAAAGVAPSKPWPPTPSEVAPTEPAAPAPPMDIPVSPLQTELALIVRDPDDDRPIV